MKTKKKTNLQVAAKQKNLKKKNDKKRRRARKTKAWMRNVKMIAIGYAKIVGIPGMMMGKIIGLSAIYVEASSIFSALESNIELLNTRP